jgi:hypothetical protein
MALTKPTRTQLPTSRWRKTAIFGKNAIRIVAFGLLAYYEFQAAAVLLIAAELIAVAEQAS